MLIDLPFPTADCLIVLDMSIEKLARASLVDAPPDFYTFTLDISSRSACLYQTYLRPLFVHIFTFGQNLTFRVNEAKATDTSNRLPPKYLLIPGI